ncbi:MAG TPA: class I SAM-dependent methyltransferase [Patescibacteria group bacterium]
MGNERKAIFETEPYWYILNRNLKTVSELQGFRDIDNYLTWMFGKRLSPQANLKSTSCNFLDLGAGWGRSTYDLVNTSCAWLMPLTVYGYDKYFLPNKPFESDPYVFDKVVKNWVKDDITNLSLYYPEGYFDKIVSSCAFGLYAESTEALEGQLVAIKEVLGPKGLFRFQLSPAQGRYIPNPNYRGRNYEPEMVLDPENYDADSDFLVETPFERFKYYKVKCLRIIEYLGLDYSLFTSVDWSSDYGHRSHYITCEVRKRDDCQSSSKNDLKNV